MSFSSSSDQRSPPSPKSTDSERFGAPKRVVFDDARTQEPKFRAKSTKSMTSKSSSKWLMTKAGGSQESRQRLLTGEPPTLTGATHYHSNVPVKTGIPIIQLIVDFDWIFLIAHLIILGLAFLVLGRFLARVVINERIILPYNAGLTVEVKNCNGVIAMSDFDYSYITLMGFATRLDDSNPSRQYHGWRNATDLWISAKMTERSNYFQCSYAIYLSRNHKFSHLNLSFLPSESYMTLMASVPLRGDIFSLKAFDIVAEFVSVETRETLIELADGQLLMGIDGEPSIYQRMNIHSRTAPIFISSSMPVRALLTKSAAKRALIRGYDISVDDIQEDWVEATVRPFGDDLNEAIRIVFSSMDSPIQIVARPLGEKSQSTSYPAWLGEDQIALPHVLPQHKRRFELAQEFLGRSSSGPFTLDLQPLGLTTTEGSFRVLSSTAFLGSNIWFVLFSGGMLQPSHYHLRFHSLGLYCRHHHVEVTDRRFLDSSDVIDVKKLLGQEFVPGKIGYFHEKLLPDSKCRKEMMLDMFVVAWHLLNDTTAVVTWRDTEGRETRYDVIDENVMVLPVTPLMHLNFSIAVAINAICAVIISFRVSNFILLLCGEVIVKAVNDDKNVRNSASHRLDNEVTTTGSGGGWNINVSPILMPTIGYRIRWSYGSSIAFTRLSIHIRSVSDGATAGEDLFLHCGSNVITTIDTTSGYQREIVMPLKFPNSQAQFNFDSSQQWNISGDEKIRMRVIGFNSQGKTVRTSNWSIESTQNALGSGIADFPFFILRRYIPAMIPSLKIFLSQLVVRQSPHNVALRIFSFEVEVSSPKRRRRSPDSTTTIAIDEELQLLDLIVHFDTCQPANGLHSSWRVKSLHDMRTGGKVSLKNQVKGSKACQMLIADTRTSLELLHERLSDRYLIFDVCRVGTRVSLGVGFLKVQDIAAMTLMANKTDKSWDICPRITVRLFDEGGTLWGTLSCKVDLSVLRKYLRHPPCTQIVDHQLLLSSEAPYSVPRELTQATSFIADIPGFPLHEGSDYTIQWYWAHGEKPEQIYIHLLDHETNEYIHSLHNDRSIPNTGTYAWSVSVKFLDGKHSRPCYLLLTVDPYTVTNPPQAIASSNGFLAQRILTLARFELAYAAFCRSYCLQMEHVSSEVLHKLGIRTVEGTYRMCKGLREPLPFESSDDLVYCPGQSLIGVSSKLVVLKGSDIVFCPEEMGNNQVNVCKSVSHTLSIIENCQLEQEREWWTNPLSAILIREDWLYGSKLFDLIHCGIMNFIYLIGKLVNSKTILMSVHSDNFNFLFKRNLVVLLQPRINTSFLCGFQVAFFHLFPFQIITTTCLFNYVVTDFRKDIPHILISPEYLFDIVFAPSKWRFFMSISWPYRFPLIYALLDLGASWLSIFITRRYVVARFPKLSVVLEAFHLQGQVLRTLISFFVITTFLMWFIIGALINNDAFIPYAIMLGSIVFTVYVLWDSYTSSRLTIHKFINENSQHLISLTLDTWFNANGIQYEDDNATVKSKESIQYKLKLKEALRTEASRILKQTVSNTERSPDDKPLLRETFCTWVYRKVIASNLQVGFDANGYPEGLENIRGVGAFGRLASVEEVRVFHNHITSLLSGYETAMLKDGVQYGPRFGYKTDNYVIPGKRFNLALAAIPNFPHPETLDDFVKVSLIFESFDRDKDDCLNEIEFTIWATLLVKEHFEAAQDWEEVVLLFNNQLGTSVHPSSGVELADFVAFYKRFGNINSDYSKIFPTVVDNDADDLSNDLSDERSLESVLEVSSDGSESEDTSEHGNASDRDPDEDEAQGFEEGLKSELRSSLNARKIQFIFDHVTQNKLALLNGSDVISSVDFLARRMTKCQLQLLQPLLGNDGLSGSRNQSRSDALVTQRRIVDSAPPLATIATDEDSETSVDEDAFKTEGTLDLAVRNIHEIIYNEIYNNFLQTLNSIFTPETIRDGIANYYDAVIVSEIQAKAARILNVNVKIIAEDVHSTTFQEITTGSPKTGYDLLAQARKYCIAKTCRNKSISDETPPMLQMSSLLEVLVACRVLRKSDVLTVPNVGGEPKILIPESDELHQILSEAIGGSTSYNFQMLDGAIRYICKNYLWFDAFRLLVKLLGIALEEDQLPGGALDGSSPKDSAWQKTISPNRPAVRRNNRMLLKTDLLAHIGAEVADAELHDRQKRFAMNEEQLNRVFKQLSNGSCFLPVDLADEAILLLTDNRMNFAASVVCLQHLRLYSLHQDTNLPTPTVLASLGLNKESDICDVDEPEDSSRLDWTQYRDGSTWHSDILEIFLRLTWSSPGSMGKSQMIEFIRELNKSIGKDVGNEDDHIITFEIFHRVCNQLHFTTSRKHSRILWLLMVTEVSRVKGAEELVTDFLPLNAVARLLIDFHLQGIDSKGQLVSFDRPMSTIVRYKGFINFSIFKRLLRQMGIEISDHGMKCIWDEMTKSPLDITDYLPAAMQTASLEVEDALQIKHLRSDNDPTGLDPTKGRLISLITFRNQIARILITGMWPESIKILMRLSLQLECSDSLLDSILERVSQRTNRYGLVKPEELAQTICTLNVEGMSYRMLNKVTDTMRLSLGSNLTREMFCIMDINHDGSLDLEELIGGFKLLFDKLLPQHIIQSVGLSQTRQIWNITRVVAALSVFFSFIGLAFSSIAEVAGVGSAAMQSVLALLGAISLQAGATQDPQKLETAMHSRLESIFGVGLEKRIMACKASGQSNQTGPYQMAKVNDRKPLRLIYYIPKKYRPSLRDPWPSIKFRIGDFVNLTPIISGKLGCNCSWSIFPKIPSYTGLQFNTFTGSITGLVGEFVDEQLRIPTDAPHSWKDRNIHHVAAVNLKSGVSIAFPKTTFTITCRNRWAGAKARITFEVSSETLLKQQLPKLRKYSSG